MCEYKIPIRYSTPQGLRYSFVPCGRCLDCQKRLTNDWVFRLREESKNFRFSTFLTLTYDNKNLPKDGNLRYLDVQHFLARLRHKFRFRFFAVGEYGYNGTTRPHYHILLFSNSNSFTCDFHDYLQVWGKGIVTADPVTNARIRYVSSYSSLSDIGRHSVRPFRRMSLRPAIGNSFFSSPVLKKSIETDKFYYRRTENGRQFYECIPRYYVRKLRQFGYVGKVAYRDTTTFTTPSNFHVIDLNKCVCNEFYKKPYRGLVENDIFYVSESYYQRNYPLFEKLKQKKAARGALQTLHVDYDLFVLSTLRFDNPNVLRRFCKKSYYSGFTSTLPDPTEVLIPPPKQQLNLFS